MNRAFRLAHFIIGERTASIYFATAALDKLKIATTIQERRLYYVPTGRPAFPAARSKVSLSQLHLLQRLVYTESEPFERLLEGQERPLGQEDMIIRFVKHLIMVATKHNSFYVALALCRLLYNYTTGEVAEIYNFVVQDPDRGRDDYYYRSRKRHLLHDLKERFGNYLQTNRGHRGEERFRPLEDSRRYVGLVKECLSRFTPWDSGCVLPPSVDPTKDIITPLQFRGTAPDNEHGIELNRIHTLLHPDCFERVVTTLGLESPERRLELPHFFMPSDGGGPMEDRFDPRGLSEGELDAMRRYLSKSATRRKRVSRKYLSIHVDGEERAYFGTDQTNGLQIRVAEDSELLEVRSIETEEEVALAIHPLNFEVRGATPAAAAIELGAGQRLLIAVQPLKDSFDEATGAVVSVDYQRPGLSRPFSWRLRRLGAWISESVAPGQARSVNYRHLAIGSLLAVICAAAFIIYSQLRDSSPDRRLIAERKGDGRREAGDGQTLPRPPSPTPEERPKPRAQSGAPGLPVPAPPRGRREQKGTPPQGTRRSPPTGPGPVGEIEVIRGRPTRLPSALLLTVRRVYVDTLGEEHLGEQLREMLARNLQSGGRFIHVEDRDQADAVFKGSVTSLTKGGGGISVHLRLVNAKGQVVWSTAAVRSGREYTGNAAAVTDELIRELLADIRRLEGKR